MTKPPPLWKTRVQTINLGRRALVMGILNVTPDSFSDGGYFGETAGALARARELIAEGADMVDVGGESTRPGAAAVGAEEEVARTVPVIETLRKEWGGLISIDTSKASVAEAALEAGADVVNDVTGMRGDARMIAVCREAQAAVVVMHMQGDPRTMQKEPHYDDVVEEVRAYFQERYATLTSEGIAAERICFDPGIGFGKTLAHNLLLLKQLPRLVVEGRPLLIGLSRKSFLGRALGSMEMAEREWPTVAMSAYTRLQGAMIHRVHEVQANREALRMVEAVEEGGADEPQAIRISR
jgi:dihydropteroate synthase